MEPKTEWENPQILVMNGDNYELLGVMSGDALPGIDAAIPSDTAIPFTRLRESIQLSEGAMLEFNKAIEAYLEWRRRLPARRVRTGITPKRGRSRRKQRLTRLQRRAKRQAR